jgi:hypothetical protein
MAIQYGVQAMTTIATGAGSKIQSNGSESAWAAEVLQADGLRLSESIAKPYGRATLGLFSKILLWGMRGYVVLSFVLIAAQLYISLKH